jgi:hypothetical protein
MDGYHIAKFVHFCALIGAIATAAVVHLATGRRDAARTIGDQLGWHSTILSASKVFPIALLVLVVSGSYMISRGGVPWSSSFVTAGLTGVVALFAIGTALSVRGRTVQKKLAQAVAEHGANQPPMPARDGFAEVAQNIPVGIVLGVMFDMTTKPALASALGVLALGAVLGGVAGFVRRAPATAASGAPTQA